MIGIDLSGRTALVTGAGRGIGGRSRRSLRPPAQSSLSMIWMTAARRDAESIVELGNALAVAGDVTAPNFPQTLVDAALENTEASTSSSTTPAIHGTP